MTGLAPNDAQANDYTCPAEITVPCADARWMRLEIVWTAAADLSLDTSQATPQARTVLVYYGDDEATRQAGIDVLDYLNKAAPGPNGEETFALLLADGHISENDFQVFIGGRDYYRLANVGSPANEVQVNNIREAVFEAIQKSAAQHATVPGPQAALDKQ
jgi:hypothetical protein